MAKLTVIGLFNLTRCLASCNIVRSLFMISACRNDGRLKALDKTIGSQKMCVAHVLSDVRFLYFLGAHL